MVPADRPGGTIPSVSDPPFELAFQENRSFLYGDAPCCPGCSRVLADGAVDRDFELRTHTFDVSVTHDGAIVVSDSFVVACAGVAGVRFEPLPCEPGHAVLRVDREVRIDPFASDVVSGPICDRCGEPRYRLRRGPLHLADDEILELGFSGTDLTFGDTADFGPDQPIRLRPHILVDRDTGQTLKRAGLIGVHLIAQP